MEFKQRNQERVRDSSLKPYSLEVKKICNAGGLSPCELLIRKIPVLQKSKMLFIATAIGYTAEKERKKFQLMKILHALGNEEIEV